MVEFVLGETPAPPEKLTKPGALPATLSRRQTARGSAFAPRVYWKINLLAERWDMNVRTVNRMIKRGELQSIKIAGRHRIPDLERVRVESMTEVV